MSINKDKYSKIHYKFTDEDKFIDKDIFDENYDDYEPKDKRNSEFNEEYDKKNVDEHSGNEDSKITINCKLKVDFDNKNKMLYLYPGKSQFFTVDVSKCCGDVTIRYNGCYPKKGIRGNLAVYKILSSGIFVETYSKLDPNKKDILRFTAIDECTKECYDFVAIFSCNLCGC